MARAEETLKALRDAAQKGALQMRCDVLSLEKHAQKERDDFQVRTTWSEVEGCVSGQVKQ